MSAPTGDQARAVATQLAAMGTQLAERLHDREGLAPRVGTDVQDIAVVADAVRRQGRRYLERVYTAGEVAASGAGEGPDAARPEVAAASLAGRYAAKEAVLKVLGSPGGVPLSDIEVRRRPDRSVALVLTGAAARLAGEAGLHGWDVSISHDGGLAVAIVMALGQPSAAGEGGAPTHGEQDP